MAANHPSMPAFSGVEIENVRKLIASARRVSTAAGNHGDSVASQPIASARCRTRRQVLAGFGEDQWTRALF
jgi:hypothetical protein